MIKETISQLYQGSLTEQTKKSNLLISILLKTFTL